MCCVGVGSISTCQKHSSTLVGPKEKLLLVRIPPSLRGTLIDNPHLQNSYLFVFAIFKIYELT